MIKKIITFTNSNSLANMSEKQPSHDVKKIKSRSYRFSGYKFKKDLDNNIVQKFPFESQPEYWKTRAINEGDK
jgi:hypothetical protein